MNATAPATAFVANMSDWEDDTDITDRPSDLDREWQQRREQHINVFNLTRLISDLSFRRSVELLHAMGYCSYSTSS